MSISTSDVRSSGHHIRSELISQHFVKYLLNTVRIVYVLNMNKTHSYMCDFIAGDRRLSIHSREVSLTGILCRPIDSYILKE